MLSLLQSFAPTQASEVQSLVSAYMEWTQSGQADLSKRIFAKQVDLSYQRKEGEFVALPFTDYQTKIESAAASVRRTMTIAELELQDDWASAHLSDLSDEGDFSAMHILDLQQLDHQWRVRAIRILPLSLTDE